MRRNVQGALWTILLPQGKLKDLADYINYKESEKRSINEHVTEVLG